MIFNIEERFYGTYIKVTELKGNSSWPELRQFELKGSIIKLYIAHIIWYNSVNIWKEEIVRGDQWKWVNNY